MSNMSYCRFQNTASDLQDCADNLRDGDLSRQEKRARANLLMIAMQMLEEIGVRFDTDAHQLERLIEEIEPDEFDEDEDEDQGDKPAEESTRTLKRWND